jgi:hypothetical protein
MSNYPIGFPQKFTGWKGKTLFQVVATIQKNSNNSSNLSLSQIRKALPLKIFRKEIHNINGQTVMKNCSGRISTKITDMEMPGTTIVSEIPHTYSNGLVNTLDINQTTLSAENGACNTANNCFSPTYNARKRVRSAGMIQKKFNINKNNDTYSTSTQQYLISRNKTIKQNEFHYIRKGNAGLIPGPGLASSNIYSPSGLSHCYQPFISVSNNNNTFSYTWVVSGTIDSTINYTVTIPEGKYDIFALNNVFQTAQYSNKTYVKSGNRTIFLMNFSYDTNSERIYLHANNITNLQDSGYSIPSDADWNWAVNDIISPSITILNNNFANLIGFLPGQYSNTNQAFDYGYILPNYVPLIYKPNNSSYGVQGAVESSARIQRLKYNTINTGAFSVKYAYGTAAANALAYGVSEQAYTAKTSVGDKPKCTPVINPRNGIVCKKRFIYRK